MSAVRFVWCFLALVCLDSSFASAQEDNACLRFADSATKRVNAIFHNHTMTFAQKSAALSRLFEESVDIAWVARFVADPQWNNASEQERANYVKAYETYLTGHYIGGLNEDDLDNMLEFTVTELKHTDTNTYKAQAKVTQKDEDPVSIDLQLEESPPGVCRVRDFTLEGVSLLTAQRDEIQYLIAQGGLAHVTNRLTEFPMTKN